jgi:integrase
LSGIRAAQARALTWDRVNFDGDTTITITAAGKRKRKRTMRFDDVTPKLRELLQAQADVTGKSGSVWGLTLDQTKRARERLLDTPGPKKRGKGMKAAYGAPEFTWQRLRITSRSACGAAQLMDPDRMARHYGHSLQVAHEHYAGFMPGVSRDASSLEEALGIEAELDEIIAATKARARQGLRAVV